MTGRFRRETWGKQRSGFTLVELLVVVSIIALLIAILLPSLRKARDSAKTVKCAANLHSVGTAMATYTAEYGGGYPVSYLYPYNAGDAYDVYNQPTGKDFGYLHWSYYLYGKGKVGETAFQCPSFENMGSPRTNPGLSPEDWDGGQVDQTGDANPNDFMDRQAPRMAYTGNAAILPRNKFTPELAGNNGERLNKYVTDSQIRNPGKTVLMTEFNKDWKLTGKQAGGGIESKSHRPVNPFTHLGSGYDEYSPACNPNVGFRYGPIGDPNYGVRPLADIQGVVGVLDGNAGYSEVNAVGRHHPGGDKQFGGTANFLFCDNHVATRTVLDTMRNFEWGEKYYALTGKNTVKMETY